MRIKSGGIQTFLKLDLAAITLQSDCNAYKYLTLLESNYENNIKSSEFNSFVLFGLGKNGNTVLYCI